MRLTPPKVPRPGRVPIVSSPTIGALSADLSPATLAVFWHDLEGRAPLIEADTEHPGAMIVTFCWRDAEADQVLLFVNRLTDETHLADSLMRRLPGTDLWHLSYRMDTDWRASYSFVTAGAGQRPRWLDDGDQVAIRRALDHGRADPHNPDTSRNRAGIVQSVVSGPDAPAQPWLHERPGVRRGVLEDAAPDGRRIWIHRPRELRPDTPLVVCFDGDVWTSTQSLPTTIDNLAADAEIRSPLTVLIDSGGRDARWRDHQAGSTWPAAIADGIIPWIRARFDVSGRREDVVVVGQSLGGLEALRVGLTRPEAMGHVIAQSASLWRDDLDRIPLPTTPVRIHLEVGRQEWVLREPTHRLAERLTGAGLEVELAEFNGGHDYACWRGGIAEALRGVLAVSPGPRGGSDRDGRGRR